MAKYGFEFEMEIVYVCLNAEGWYKYLASKYSLIAKSE